MIHYLRQQGPGFLPYRFLAQEGGDGATTYEDLCDQERLIRACRKVRRAARRHRPRGGEPVAPLEDLRAHVGELLEELRNGTYRPAPPRRWELPKRGGGVRVVCAFRMRDRIVYRAVKDLLEEQLDRQLATALHGYRPGRSVATAIKVVRDLVAQGYIWAVAIDIEDCFGSLNLLTLGRLLRKRISDERLLSLVGLIIAGGSERSKGVPQGSSLSPLLANVYLSALVDRLVSRGIPGRLVAYADDLLLLCKSRSQARRARKMVKKAMAELGLTPSDKKGGEANLDHQTIEYLGLVVSRRKEVGEGRACLVRPNQEAYQRLREMTGHPASERGWTQYYRSVEAITREG